MAPCCVGRSCRSRSAPGRGLRPLVAWLLRAHRYCLCERGNQCELDIEDGRELAEVRDSDERDAVCGEAVVATVGLRYCESDLLAELGRKHAAGEGSAVERLRIALTEIDCPREALARCKEDAPDEVAALIKSLWEGSPDVDEWSRMGPDSRLRSLNALTKDMLTSEDKLQGLVLNDMRNLRRELERFGNTERVGFSLFDLGKEPVRFSYLRYSVDAMLPFIDLHAYNYYYPVKPWVRVVSVVQHVCGWWWLTVFIASAAIL